MDLTGQWWGTYFYPAHAGPATPYIAKMQDQGGHLQGTVAEPDQVSGIAVLMATIVGHRHGMNVDFTKTYARGAPTGYENPVDYVGHLSSDGNSIHGVWSLLELDGRFEMHREMRVVEQGVETHGANVDFLGTRSSPACQGRNDLPKFAGLG